MVMIAHASIDENRGIKNGLAGDQTEKEVCIRAWYNKPWGCVIRFNDENMAEKVARFMTAAAANNNIGYDQNQRNTVLTEARKHNYDASKITTPCEADCSSLVSVACMYAGVPESALTLHGNCATTRTLKNILKSTGEVSVFTTPLYTSNPDRLKRGDILLKEGSHTAVVVTSGNPYRLTKIAMHIGCKGESVKWLQWQLNSFGYKLDIDGDFGPLTKSAVIEYQKTHLDVNGNKLVVDGIAGSKTLGALKRG